MSFFVIEDNPEWGKLWVTQSLAKFSAMPGGVHRGSPLLGEHTEEVLGELGVDSTQLQELRARKVVL